MSRRRLRWAALVIGIAALATNLTAAEQVWVTDRIQLGLHEDASLRSRVLELLPSGTPLTVLAREGALAQVRTEHGTVGWVGIVYLSEEAPARPRLAQLEAEHEQLLHESARLRQLGAELEVALSQAQARAREAEARLGGAAGGGGEPDRLCAADARSDEPPGPGAVPSTADTAGASDGLPTSGPRRYLALAERGVGQALSRSGWEWAALAVSTLVGVGFGAWLVDWRNRRRHGGFRV